MFQKNLQQALAVSTAIEARRDADDHGLPDGHFRVSGPSESPFRDFSWALSGTLATL
ncbi:MAG: hypothetical protein WAV22_10990 [Porticoccaceae bacterium]